MQVQTSTESGGRKDERVSRLQHATRSAQAFVQGLAQRKGPTPWETVSSRAPVWGNIVPKGLINDANFKQSRRR